jgi:hypothetical protein
LTDNEEEEEDECVDSDVDWEGDGERCDDDREGIRDCMIKVLLLLLLLLVVEDFLLLKSPLLLFLSPSPSFAVGQLVSDQR